MQDYNSKYDGAALEAQLDKVDELSVELDTTKKELTQEVATAKAELQQQAETNKNELQQQAAQDKAELQQLVDGYKEVTVDKVTELESKFDNLADCIIVNPDFNPNDWLPKSILGEIGETAREGNSESFGRYEIDLNGALYVSASVIGVVATTSYITFLDVNGIIVDKVKANISTDYERITFDYIPVPTEAVKVVVNTYKAVGNVDKNYVKIWENIGKVINVQKTFNANLFSLTNKEEIFLDDYPIRDYTLLDSGKYGTSSDYKHIIVPVMPYDSVEIIGGETIKYIAWMKSDAAPAAGQAAEIVEGTVRMAIEPYARHYLNAPLGANGLYVSLGRQSEGIAFLKTLTITRSRYHHTTRKTIELSMEMGGIYNGETYFAGTVIERMLARLRTPMFINVSNYDKIVKIDGLAEDEYFYIYCYDDKFNYISASKTLELAKNTAYIKVAIRKNDATQVFGSEKKIALTVDTAHEINFVKNYEPPFVKKTISFKVELPMQDTLPPMSDYAGGNSIARIWDNGYIYLPYNYTRNGDAVPLVIFAHGTNGLNYTNSSALYGEYVQIFLHNGYAVADCSCKSSYYGTSYYGHLEEDTQDSKLSPLVMSCYAGLYKHLVSNYNIKTDGVYLASKSAGGLVTTYMSYNAPFPVKCVANLAPALSMVGNSWRVTNANALNFWLRAFYMDVDSHPVAAYLKGEGDLDFVLENIDKVYGYDPLFKNSDLPFKDVITLMYSTAPSSVGSTNQEQVTNAYLENNELMSFFNSAKKFQPIPVKNWIATDDTTVPIEIVKVIQGMVRRGNGIWEVRELPAGTGGHHATDNDVNALKVVYKCADGESLEYPIAYAEVVDWFNRH